MNDQSSSVDPRPFFWVLSILLVLAVVWLGFRYWGEQRYHNTPRWQSWRPVKLASPPQTAHPVEVRDDWRNALTVVQTEKGLYFLSGTKHVPAQGSQVIVQANDHWELYLCEADGSRCMTIHSFCAGAVWPNVKRDEKGRAQECYAPYLGSRSKADLESPPKPDPRSGPGRRQKAAPPPVGMSHPREWASLMGLPVSEAQAQQR
ncbi:MAG: hypothetical protein FJY34_01065 [Betaproteobacteria bacterium]|nr:hypothetical protein [Betaproteobacteria bacterium]